MSNSCRDDNLNIIFTGEGILYQAHEVGLRIAESVSHLLEEGGMSSTSSGDEPKDGRVGAGETTGQR